MIVEDKDEWAFIRHCHVAATDYIPEFAILAGTFTLLYKRLMQAVYRVVTNKTNNSP
jgi:hypothetical protein